MRSDIPPYCPLFDVRTKKPIHGYYALVAFDTLYRLGDQVETQCDDGRLYVLAASDGVRRAALIANLTGQTKALSIEGIDETAARYSVIDGRGALAWAPHAKEIENDTVLLIEW
jgi:hypothetical protein